MSSAPHGNTSLYQDVVKIEHIDGDRGGRSWFLTLACGHFKSVRIPVFKN